MPLRRRGKTWYYDFRLDGRRYLKRVGPSRDMAVHAEGIARDRAIAERYRREWGTGWPPSPESLRQLVRLARRNLRRLEALLRQAAPHRG